MSTKIGSVIRKANVHLVIISLVGMSASGVILAAPESSESAAATGARSSISLQYVRGGRDNPTEIRTSTEDYGALITSGVRGKPNKRGALSKSGVTSSKSQSAGFDFWFYKADVILFNDDDNDGYFFGIDLLFDVDTIYDAADVYAVLYLSYEGGPWNEYAVSEDFTVFGTTATDEYVLVTELMSGYPTGSYDILIELYDALDNTFLAEYGPADSSVLSFLPLEDFDRDAPIEVVVITPHGGGGAFDSWLLGAMILLLLVSAVRKIWHRRNDALVRIDSPSSPTSFPVNQ
jgi:hypothetical protein